jgi:hypothetical protein
MGSKAGPRYANHPLVQFVRALDGEFYLTREVADQVDCSVAMLDYLRRRSTDPLGPTHQARYGGIELHLYTPERIAEIAKYIAENSRHARGQGRHGPTILWTRTEQLARSRNMDRARNYRVRGARYAAEGKTKEAARMAKMNTTLRAKLDKERAKRYQQVHGKPLKKAT